MSNRKKAVKKNKTTNKIRNINSKQNYKRKSRIQNYQKRKSNRKSSK